MDDLDLCNRTVLFYDRRMASHVHVVYILRLINCGRPVYSDAVGERHIRIPTKIGERC